jgi:hypothetical protein
MDHEEMQGAMNRALDEINNDYCNNCKNPFDKNQGGYTKYQGGYTNFITVTKMYKVWYCDDCFELMVF